MKVLITEQLSKHRYKTDEGYMVCVNAILARTGQQIYKHNQVYDNSTDEITDVSVDRKPEQVFSKQAIASFENKPLTVQHPNVPVDAKNHKELSGGFVRDVQRAVKRGSEILTGRNLPNNLLDSDTEVLVGNIIITDANTINAVEDGLDFLSCGYDCDITQTDKPEQINIRGNHIALCDNPRAGITMLQDNVEFLELPMKHIVKVLTDAVIEQKNKVRMNDSDKMQKYFGKWVIPGGRPKEVVKIEGIHKARGYTKYANEFKAYKLSYYGKMDTRLTLADVEHSGTKIFNTLTEVKKYLNSIGQKLDSIEDAINYVVMCEQLYNGSPVKSRAPWIVFRSEDKRKAEQFVKENNAKAYSLKGFSNHYYLK